MVTKVAVCGATGRLGKLICEVIAAHPEFVLSARLDSRSDPALADSADIVCDATTLAVSEQIVRRALSRGQKVLVATSGWASAQIAQVQPLVAANPAAALIIIPNFSLGSALGTVLAAITAPFYDSVEIVETHHAAKIDAPSGTAVRTAEMLAAARPAAAPLQPVPATGAAAAARGFCVEGVPIHALRLAGAPPRQEVCFSGPGESLRIVNDTYSQQAYAAGVLLGLRAARDRCGLLVGLEQLLNLQHLLPQSVTAAEIAAGEAAAASPLSGDAR